jgi:NAD-dependent DNA ligase
MKSSPNLPLTSRQLIFSDATFCVTGVKSNEEQKIKQIIKFYGGKLSDNLTRHVQLLLVRRVGSNKYKIAKKMNMNCVHIQWLYDCDVSKRLLEHDSYKVKPFTGFYFSITGYPPDERFRLQQLITENGGTNCVNMTKNECTHLIAAAPEGQKYEFAKVSNS